MAETLGSLCDKLTIVKLKVYHTEDEARLASLNRQSQQLIEEIDEYLALAASGGIPAARLAFAANKVYDRKKFSIDAAEGSLGSIVSQLALANCELWHAQEKVYNFENLEEESKQGLINDLAKLNLKRTACIDGIDRFFQDLIKQLQAESPPGT